jgi:23S rRNA (cytosine1962-C5)-methyltransferase
MPSPPPTLQLKKHEDRRLREGHVWVYSNEVDTDRTPLRDISPGSQVLLIDHHGKPLGIAMANPHSLICARLVSRDVAVSLSPSLIMQRINIALSLRQRVFPRPFYRLVHGEGDGLPGLVVDRFGDVLVLQITTAGMQREQQAVLAALEKVLQPRSIVLRNDSPMRKLEGLKSYVEVAVGELPEEILIEENDTTFAIDVISGQKTGWFYDHRMNRQRMQHYVRGLRVLDVFSYIGGWGLQALTAGAREAVCVDTSSSAIDRLHHNAELNGTAEKLATIEGDAFEALKSLRQQREHFDLVVVDPPAFIKRRKDLKAGLLAYRRINQMAMQLLNTGGYLVSGSCSFHLEDAALRDALLRASRHLDRNLQIIEQGSQGPDHPVHPAIPETRYLKAFIGRLHANT